MQFAAIADIHGNLAALKAVLADIAEYGISDIVNLGDHVSGPLEAGRTADLLMERDFPSIMGDQDRRLVELSRAGGADSKRVDYNQLTTDHLSWMASMPSTITYQGEAFLCHGSPISDHSYWLDRIDDRGTVRASTIEEIEAEVGNITASLILCAHTHIPRLVRLRDGRPVINPGSVGCPGYIGRVPLRHTVQLGTPDACYAILQRNACGWSATFRHVPYDSQPMAQLALRNGSRSWASALATGWIQ